MHQIWKLLPFIFDIVSETPFISIEALGIKYFENLFSILNSNTIDLPTFLIFFSKEVQSTWECDEEMYNLAWEMVMEDPDKYRDQEFGEGDYDNEVVYHDCII